MAMMVQPLWWRCRHVSARPLNSFQRRGAARATDPARSGEGSTYRVITQLWRGFFRAPRDTRDNGWYENRRQPVSKLIADGPRENPQAFVPV